MVTRQSIQNDTQFNHTTKTSLWLGVLLVVISFASLSLVFSSFPNTAFASISSPSYASNGSVAQSYSLNTPPHITTTSASMTSTRQQSKELSEHSSSAIPSPAPLSLVALLLLVLASAIRRHQNQTWLIILPLYSSALLLASLCLKNRYRNQHPSRRISKNV